jgi:hypothetical protein
MGDVQAARGSTSAGVFMKKVLEKLWEEFLKVIPPTIYFLIALSLLVLARGLFLRAYGISASTQFKIVISALILGKSVLIADLLPFVNRFPEKPLIYNVAWKSLIYNLVALLIHYVERLLDYWKDFDGFVGANREMFDKLIWPHFWGVQILLLMLIVPYSIAHELGRVMGRERFRKLFFGSAGQALAPQQPAPSSSK